MTWEDTLRNMGKRCVTRHILAAAKDRPFVVENSLCFQQNEDKTYCEML